MQAVTFPAHQQVISSSHVSAGERSQFRIPPGRWISSGGICEIGPRWNIAKFKTAEWFHWSIWPITAVSLISKNGLVGHNQKRFSLPALPNCCAKPLSLGVISQQILNYSVPFRLLMNCPHVKIIVPNPHIYNVSQTCQIQSRLHLTSAQIHPSSKKLHSLWLLVLSLTFTICFWLSTEGRK